jgi:hypothetical protein
LVGHGFARKVVAAVADRAPEPPSKVIYLDAFRPERVRTPHRGFDPRGEFGPPPQESFGLPLTEGIVARRGRDVKGANPRRILSLSTPWPIKLATDAITLSARCGKVKRAHVFCPLAGDPVDEIVAGKWGKLEGPQEIIETGHWPMITRPEELARDLILLAK